MLYLHGKGVEQDEGKACQLFQRSHKKGNPYASFELGKLYEAGRGTQRNTDLAEKCYRVAFLGFLNLEKKSRDDTLWYRIGTMYLQGVGTEADEKEAEKYLCKSAGYGNTLQPINWQSCTSVRKRRNCKGTRKKYRTIKKSSRYLNGWRQLPSRAILLQIMPLGSCIRTEN